MTRTFWSLLAEGVGRQRPSAAWEAAAGVEMVGALREAGVLSALPPRPGDPWPCVVNAATGCARRIVARGEERIAVCGLVPASCASEVLAPGEVLLAVDRAVLLARLAMALGVETRVEDHGGPRPVLLGERAIGGARLRFLWVDRPRWSGLGDALFRMASGSELAALVLLVAHPSQVPAEVARELGGVRVFWLALADAADWEDRRLRVDLADVVLALDLPVDLGPLLWPRYALVIDQRRDQVWYGGRLVKLAGTSTRFLALLADRPGDVLTKRAAILALWGDEIPRNRVVSVERYDQRLRQLRSALSAAFRSCNPPMSLPQDPVELVRGEEDLQAGYRLGLGEGRVALVQGTY